MAGIIAVFPKLEDAKGIKNLLSKRGFTVNAVCTSGSQAVSAVEQMGEGIVICGYKFTDMTYRELQEYLPAGGDMLLMASPSKLSQVNSEGIVCLEMPIKVQDMVDTLHMIEMNAARRKPRKKQKPKRRDKGEQMYIDKAKKLLMERNHLSEEEAHHYIQKASMDSQTNMVEMAQMILDMMDV